MQQLNLAEDDAIELGYRIRQRSWNQGYTTEAARALIDRSFSKTKVTKINAWALIENKGSTRVMEKAGLKLQQEYIVNADAINDELVLANPLVQNLLGKTVVKYQIKKPVSLK